MYHHILVVVVVFSYAKINGMPCRRVLIKIGNIYIILALLVLSLKFLIIFLSEHKVQCLNKPHALKAQ